jgi:hypothetical protein
MPSGLEVNVERVGRSQDGKDGDACGSLSVGGVGPAVQAQAGTLRRVGQYCCTIWPCCVTPPHTHIPLAHLAPLLCRWCRMNVLPGCTPQGTCSRFAFCSWAQAISPPLGVSRSHPVRAGPSSTNQPPCTTRHDMQVADLAFAAAVPGSNVLASVDVSGALHIHTVAEGPDGETLQVKQAGRKAVQGVEEALKVASCCMGAGSNPRVEA